MPFKSPALWFGGRICLRRPMRINAAAKAAGLKVVLL